MQPALLTWILCDKNITIVLFLRANIPRTQAYLNVLLETSMTPRHQPGTNVLLRNSSEASRGEVGDGACSPYPPGTVVEGPASAPANL